MEIPVKEILEKLAPLLAWYRIGCRRCKEPGCTKAIEGVDDWLKDILKDEKEKEFET
jgi:hypothetical protein